MSHIKVNMVIEVYVIVH